MYWPTFGVIGTVIVVVMAIAAYYYFFFYRRRLISNTTSSSNKNGGDYVKVSPLEPPPMPMPNATSAVSAVAGAMGSVVVPVSLKAKEGVEFIMGGGEV